MKFNKYFCTMQHDNSDCAAAVISSILKYYKKEITLSKIREVIGTDAYGTTVKGIVEGLEKMNFEVRAIRVEVKEVDKSITLPAIAQITTKSGNNHFVVLYKITKNNIYILADPAKGIVKIKEEEFLELFSGILILMIPKSEFEDNIKKDNNIVDLFIKLIFPQKKLLLTIILSSIFISFVGLLLSTFSKILMDEIIPYQLRDYIILFLICFGIITLIQTILVTFRQQVILYLSRKVDIPLLLAYYDHILHLPYNFFESRKIGDITTRFQDALTLKNIFTSVSISLIMDFLLAFISSFILFQINSVLFFILVCMVIVSIILLYIFKRPYKKLNYEEMEANSSLNSHLIESLQNIDVIKSTSEEKKRIYELEKKFVNVLKIQYKEGTLSNIQGVTGNLFGTLGNLIFMGIGAFYIIDGKMTIGDLLVFQTISSYFTSPVSNLISLQLTFQEANISMKRLNEIISLEREDANKEEKISDIKLNEDIFFDNINFSYNSRRNILSNFSLKIEKGKKYALVGESGSGKTTIIKLLMNYIKPNNGSISIGSYNIQDIDYKYLRSKIAYIPQKVKLFTGTILENLRMGNDQITYEEIVTICKKTGADKFIEKLPNRYNSLISENGLNFSEGEKQKLSIVRALLKEADIYILDEITSSLDSLSEEKIKQIIFSDFSEKTMIIIAHRLSTIRECDQIVMIKNGQVIEQGTHEELLKNENEYSKMVNLQDQVKVEKNYKSKEVEEEITYA